MLKERKKKKELKDAAKGFDQILWLTLAKLAALGSLPVQILTSVV